MFYSARHLRFLHAINPLPLARCHPEPSQHRFVCLNVLKAVGEGSAPLLFRATDLPASLGEPYDAAEPILPLRRNRIETLCSSRGSRQDGRVAGVNGSLTVTSGAVMAI
jgi:hypothetical protein